MSPARFLPLIAGFVLGCAAVAAPALPRPKPSLESYLGDVSGFDPAIPTPGAHLGIEPGEFHYRHDQVLSYFEALAAASDRVHLQEYGRTFTGRRLFIAVFATPERIASLEEVRQAHLASVRPDALPSPDRPTVAFMTYGVHGDEPSATHAAVVAAYWLAAAPEAQELLQDVIVVMDPCLNPEGHDRFALWANDHRGSHLVASPLHREHRQNWPGGRFNHWWFDLNRDYLPMVHAETRGRMQAYWSWSPDVHGDWHEMGTHSTYFFQPGVPTRNHPLVGEDTVALTTRIAEFHAKALGDIGSAFFTRERFDDFYIGKASTYADVTGGIGILFEQGSARGHIQESVYGDLSFPFAIRNQVVTSLSFLRAARLMRSELTARRVPFLAAASQEAAAAGIEGWLLASPEDPGRTRMLAGLLQAHGAGVRWTTAPVTHNGVEFPSGSLWVPAAQQLHRFLRAALEERIEFEDTTFYDISAWSLAHAYGQRFAEIPWGTQIPSSATPPVVPAVPVPDAAAYAWLIDWRDHGAGAALQRLQDAGVAVQVSLSPLRVAAMPGIAWPAGTLVVLRGVQRDVAVAASQLAEIAAAGVPVASVDARMSLAGPDLGSDDMRVLQARRIALLAGEGMSVADVSSIRFTIDQRFGAQVALIEPQLVASARLQGFTTIILPGGNYTRVGEAGAEALRSWVRAGGTLIAVGSSVRWAATNNLLQAEFVPEAEVPSSPGDTYGNLESSLGVHRISGAIFGARADLSHPLAFGLGREAVSLFVQSSLALRPPSSSRLVALRYADEPRIAGFASPENRRRFAGTPAVLGQRLGAGAVVALPANPVFRAYWHGAEKLLLNAIHFAPHLRAGGVEIDGGDDAAL